MINSTLSWGYLDWFKEVATAPICVIFKEVLDNDTQPAPVRAIDMFQGEQDVVEGPNH